VLKRPLIFNVPNHYWGKPVRQVSETIPAELVPQVDAAVAWFNASAESDGETFKVTGIVDADEALQGSSELQLILCGGDRCEQRAFRVSGGTDTWSIELSDGIFSQQGEKPQAELDPPPGARLQWLNNTLAQHAFVVLLFYRGFW